MASEGHVALLKQGLGAWNKWRKENPGIQPSLFGAHLSKAKLIFADLSDADLSDADLSGADLWQAKLIGANLVGADLSGANLLAADLSGAMLYQADLSGANLNKASLTLANFTGANLRGAYLNEALLIETVLADADLTEVKGLDSYIYGGPSVVDHRTILKSGPLPRAFLLGCGVPLELPDVLLRIKAETKYYTCFIAYGEPDRKFAEELVHKLNSKAVSCWLYSINAKVGERTWKDISQRRKEAEKMVVLCSIKGLLRDGLLKEIEEQIDENPDMMVPISLDDLWKEPGFRVIRGTRDLKPFLLDKNYADFTNLRYDDVFDRLLKGIERPKESL